MENFFRSLCITISSAIFSFIPKLYQLFYDLAAKHDLFSEETIRTFSNNIYVLVSVVMLFAFAIKAIESIINPDMLFDGKKGYVSVIKRSVIALVLIIGIPFGFDLFYKFQDEVMSKSLIEKLIIGVAVNDGENIAEKSNGGVVLSRIALSSVLYPKNIDTCEQYEDADVCTKYQEALDDPSKSYKLIIDINEKDENDEYILVYEWVGILSIVIGIVILYMLALFCIDTALRLVKLAFLEIIAPISVVAYIYGGNDILKKWWKETMGTAFSLFGRVAALALMIFVLSKLPEFLSGFDSVYSTIINLFVIIATLIFVKEAPSMIEKLFGIKIGGKGGISGRLGSMAGVGDIAKNGFDKMKTLGALGTAGTVAAGAALTGMAAKGLDNKFLNGMGQAKVNQIKDGISNIGNKVSNSSFGQQVGRVGRVASAGMKAGGTTGAIKAAGQAYKDDKLTKSNKDIVQAQKDKQFMNNQGIDTTTGSLLSDTTAPVTSTLNPSNTSRARQLSQQLSTNVNRDKVLNKAQKDAINNKINSDKNKATIEKLQKNHTNVKDGLKSLSETAIASGNASVGSELTTLMNNFNSGNMSTTDLGNELNRMVSSGLINQSAADGIMRNLDGINHITANAEPGSVVANLGSGGTLSAAALGNAVTTATNAVASADATLKLETDKAGDNVKHTMENYTKAAETINEEYVKEVNKAGAKMDRATAPTNAKTQNNNQQSQNAQNTKTNTQSTTQNTQSSAQSSQGNAQSNSQSNNKSNGYEAKSYNELYENHQAIENELLNRTYNNQQIDDTYIRGRNVDINDVRNKYDDNKNKYNEKETAKYDEIQDAMENGDFENPFLDMFEDDFNDEEI